MTKREKILLQIMMGVLLVGLTLVYLLFPQMKKGILLQKEYDEENELAASIEGVLAVEGLEEGLKEAENKANETYELFNGEVSSIKIDDLVNGLVSENNLSIRSLSISSYNEYEDEELVKKIKADESVPSEEEAYDDEDDEDDEEEEISNLLIGCDVSFKVVGTYEDTMNLLEQISSIGAAIVITEFAYSYEVNDIETLKADLGEEHRYIDTTIQMRVYGLKPYNK